MAERNRRSSRRSEQDRSGRANDENRQSRGRSRRGRGQGRQRGQPTQRTSQTPQGVASGFGAPRSAAFQTAPGAYGAPTQQWGGGFAPQGVAGGQQVAAGQQLVGQPETLYPEQFADHLTEELRISLDDCIDVSHVAAWAADQCLDVGPEQGEAARLSNETAELAGLVAKCIARDARSTPAVIEAYLEAAEFALDELETVDAPHTNEAAMVIEHSIESTTDALDAF